MLKTVFIFLLMIAIAPVYAQYNTRVYNQYLDFNEAQFKNQPNIALQKADSILSSSEKLPAKAQIIFNRGLAKLYEDQNQPEKAIMYNEKVIAAVPDYFVSHRALGYLYLLPTNQLIAEMEKAKNSANEHQKYQQQYFTMLKKALPHLEKAEACDHDDETLNLIKNLYQKLNDKAGLTGLDGRLKQLKTHCIDLLTE
jgi:tetratricopeptide (TPR) repeat protein